MPRAGDETWRRLLEWTAGQTPSERLAAQVLRGEGYQGIDPSHPLGGPDGGRDAVASKAGKRWIMAVYFPRGRESFGAIRKKFLDDLVAASKHKPDGLVFVTNQELTLSERSELSRAAGSVEVDIYHLERLASILDSPAYYGARLEYLGIPMTMEEQLGFFKSLQDASNANFAELRGLIDGGDTFCYLALYDFDMDNGIARQVMLVKKGKFALKDLSLRATELSVSPGPITVQMGARPISVEVGTLSAVAMGIAPAWTLGNGERRNYNIGFFALNGNWVQMLRLTRAADYWATATRVIRGTSVVFEEIDPEYVRLAGEPEWG